VRIEAAVEKYEAMAKVFESLGQAMNELLSRHSDKELAIIQDFMSRLPELMEKETKKLRELK
jgi:hypothetical protein